MSDFDEELADQTAASDALGWKLPLFLGAMLLGVVIFSWLGHARGPFVLQRPRQVFSDKADASPVVTMLFDYGQAHATQAPTRAAPATAAPATGGDAAGGDAAEAAAIETKQPWRAGMTVLSLLQQGGQQVVTVGSGAGALVTAIGGVANQDQSGWQFEVNGERGNKSAGVSRLQAGDRVLWIYGPYE